MNSFDTRAKSWDLEQRRVQNASAIAKAIEQKIPLSKQMRLLDLGVGTGLLGSCLASRVGKIIGVDNSQAMLEEFMAKKDTFVCEIEPVCLDVNKEPLTFKVDGIISSMTLHHIKDIARLFENFAKILPEGGFLALADLVSEDGSFHSDNTGVYHFGFEKDALVELAKKSGFEEIAFEVVHTITKPHKSFDVFLLTAQKA